MLLIQGRRASQRSALAPGYYIPRLRRYAPSYSAPSALRPVILRAFGATPRHIPRLWRYAELLPADEVVDGLVVVRLPFVVRRAPGPGLGEVVAVLKRYYEVVHYVL